MAQNSTLMPDELDIDAFLNPTMDDGSINAVMEPVTSLQPATLSQGTYALGDIGGFELHSSGTPAYNGSQDSSHDVVDLLRPTKTEGEASSSSASSTGTSFVGNTQKASLLSPTALAISAVDGMNSSAAFHNLGSMAVLNTLTPHLTHDEQATATKKANLLALATVAKKAGDKAKEVIAIMGKLQEFLTHLITLADSSGPQVKLTVQMLVQKLVAGAITEEEFATKIEQDLRSQHQPSLLPFLQKSVPHFRTKLKFQQAFMKEILQKQQQQVATPATLQPPRPSHPLQQTTSPSAPLSNNVSPQPGLPAAASPASTPPPVPQAAPIIPMAISSSGAVPAAAGSPSPQPITIPLLNQQQLQKLTPEQRVAYVQQLQKLQQKGTIKLPPQIQQALFNAMPQGVSPQATGVVVTPSSSAIGTGKLPILQAGQVQVQAGTIASLQAAMEKQKLLAKEQQQASIVISAKLPQPALKPLAAAGQQSTSLASSSSPSPKTSFADMKLAKLGPVGAILPQAAPPTPAGKKSKGKTKGADDKQEAVDEEEEDEGMDIAGVNLQEEHVLPAKVSETVSRSCGDRVFLNLPALQRRIASIARKYGITDIAEDFAVLLSHATEERLRDIVEKLAVISQHRVEVLKDSEHYEVTSEVKEQLKVLEKIDRINVKRKQEREKEKLLRAAKSRSKADDPELAKIKEKAKQLQMEEEQIIRDRAANATALAALGNRRKRALDGEASSSQPVVGLTGTATSNGGQTVANVFGSASGPRQPKRRITVRDVVFFMEGERETRKSLLLYKSLFK